MLRIEVNTRQKEQFVDITSNIAGAVPPGFTGVCFAYVAHTTAGLTINENADPDVTADIIRHLRDMVPKREDFRHIEGNSDAHIKASLMGSSVTVPVEEGKLVLGTWQSVYFCEFDGPRRRKVFLTLLGSS